MTEPFEWDESVPQEWEPGLQALQVVDEPDGFALVGPCPRCRHALHKPLFDQVGVGTSLSPASSTGRTKVLLRCNCTEAHRNRPEGVSTGCGAFGGVWLQS